MKISYENEYCKLIQGDSLKLLEEFDNESIDVIITDPPYFLSDGGITCQNGKMVSVDKGEWDKFDNIYSVEKFYNKFLTESKRILKDEGTLFVFGTMHNIYILGYLLQKLDYKLLNNITWQKTNPAPNLSCRMFTHSTETILWAKKNNKSKHKFNYDLMKKINGGKQMKDVWTSSTTKQSEKKNGKHPTQKPLWLMERLILASTDKNSIILDCFSGSGTTLIAGYNNERKTIGIELDSKYIDLSIKRLKEAENLSRQISIF